MSETTQQLLTGAFVNHHVNSYKEYLRTFQPQEYPDWVSVIADALNSGDMNPLRFFRDGKFIAVYEALKQELSVSKSDSL